MPQLLQFCVNVLSYKYIKVFRVWPWRSSGVEKNSTVWKPVYDFLFDFYGQHLSRTVFEIFDFKVFRVWPWLLTPEDHLGSKKFYCLKAHIWLPIWLPWTTSLYLVPFQRYSTSKFLGFDLDLWPLKVIWGQKFLYYSKAYILCAAVV